MTTSPIIPNSLYMRIQKYVVLLNQMELSRKSRMTIQMVELTLNLCSLAKQIKVDLVSLQEVMQIDPKDMIKLDFIIENGYEMSDFGVVLPHETVTYVKKIAKNKQMAGNFNIYIANLDELSREKKVNLIGDKETEYVAKSYFSEPEHANFN